MHICEGMTNDRTGPHRTQTLDLNPNPFQSHHKYIAQINGSVSFSDTDYVSSQFGAVRCGPVQSSVILTYYICKIKKNK